VKGSKRHRALRLDAARAEQACLPTILYQVRRSADLQIPASPLTTTAPPWRHVPAPAGRQAPAVQSRVSEARANSIHRRSILTVSPARPMGLVNHGVSAALRGQLSERTCGDGVVGIAVTCQ
jgi:hypothetical protein